MAFILKKKRYKFQVDLCLEELSEISYSKAVIFAKVRQLDGGAFTDSSKRMEVENHRVKYNAKFMFPCKMTAAMSSGILDTAKCRISIRMEEKSGKFRKLGFIDINLAEYAGAGPSTQRYILQPYDLNHRLDNSILQVSVNVTLREGDTIFQRPLTRNQPIALPGESDSSSSKRLSAASSSAAAATSGGIGSGSLSVSQVPTHHGGGGGAMSVVLRGSNQNPTPHVLANDLLVSSSSSAAGSSNTAAGGGAVSSLVNDPSNYTRNSSNTSAGYSSNTGTVPTLGVRTSEASLTSSTNAVIGGHSRQSSSGDSSIHARNLSQGSSDTGFFGSMEKEKRRLQKQQLDDGRFDTEKVIAELIEGVDLEKVVHEEAETSGLQLYVGKDGGVAFDKHSARSKDYKPVVVDGSR